MQGQFAPLAAAHEPVTLTRKQTSQASVGQNRHRRDAARQDDGRGGIGERATIATSVGLPSGSSCCASLRITLFTPKLAPAARPARKPSPSAFRAMAAGPKVGTRSQKTGPAGVLPPNDGPPPPPGRRVSQAQQRFEPWRQARK